MHNSAPIPAGEHAQPWRHAARSFLALSAAVSVDLLEEKDQHGRHSFERGRHKYYGIGSLVIFFALFSGYGMGHMLATMSTISAWGAALAGAIWASFQWCLERQILISIRANAAWWQKCFGLSWRAALALLSASTMVYPFFVESNRTEIDVKVGEMARARLIDNNSTAQLAVGLPALLERSHEMKTALSQVDVLLASDPPELGGLRQKAKHCWTRFQEEATQVQRQLRTLRTTASILGVDALQDAKIERLQRKLGVSKLTCAGADNLVLNTLLAWKRLKNAEKQILLSAREKLQDETTQARQKEQVLVNEQAVRIAKASHSGFAADFAAVAELVRDDANRRFQLIWWLVWFLSIEMVAILVKFTTITDVDLRLFHDENLSNFKAKLIAELRLPVLVFKGSLLQLEELEALSQASSLTQQNPQRLLMLEQAIAQIAETFSASLGRKPSSASR